MDREMCFESRSETTFSALPNIQFSADRTASRHCGRPSKLWTAVVGTVFLGMAGSAIAQTIDPDLSIDEFRATAEEAYVYAFPMLVAYKVLLDYNVNQNSGAFLAPFNQINNQARVFTPKAIVGSR